jgi:hypothetical protein
VTILPAAAAALVIAGAIAVVSARGPVLVTVGGAVMLAATPLLSDPLPSALVIAERVVGALLAAELLWLGLRGRPTGGRSALPWFATVLLGLAGFAIGAAVSEAAVGAGSPEALGTAIALLTVAVIAAAGRNDGARSALVGLVLVAATGAIRTAIAGPTSPLESLLMAALGVAVAAAVALLVVMPPTAIAAPMAVRVTVGGRASTSAEKAAARPARRPPARWPTAAQAAPAARATGRATGMPPDAMEPAPGPASATTSEAGRRPPSATPGDRPEAR